MGNTHGHNLSLKVTAGLRLRGFFLTPNGKGILILTGDTVGLNQVFCCLSHGFRAMVVLHFWVDEAPAKAGIVQLAVCAISPARLAHHIGAAGHAFYAASNEEVAVARSHGASGMYQGTEARGAKPIDGLARHR